MFKKGDVVVLRTGNKPQRIIDLNSVYLRVQYLSDPDQEHGRWRSKSDFRHYEPDTTTSIQETLMAKLYQTKDAEPKYGTFMCRNGIGQIVLDMKGTNLPMAFNEEDLVEVRPYTVCLSDNSHYITKPESVARGDWVLGKGGVMRVTQLDTKCDSASVNLSDVFQRIQTSPIA